MKRAAVLTAFGVAVSCGIAAAATPTMRDVLAGSYAVRDLNEVALAPGGDAVAWQEVFHDPRRLLASPRYDAVYAQRLSGGRVQLTALVATGCR